MNGPLFFVPSLRGHRVRLSEEDSRHALRSLRLRPGEGITLADGEGAVAEGVIAGEEGGMAVVEVERVRREPRPSPWVSVALAPPKGDRLAWAVQKLAEVGVDEVALIRTERSVRQWPAGRAERATERMRGVAREAAMQARRPFVPGVRADLSFRDAVTPEGSATVFLMQGARSRLHQVLPAAASRVRLVVGPEGGWAEEEVELAARSGAAAASLGPTVLRTETAAVVAASLALARYGRLG